MGATKRQAKPASKAREAEKKKKKAKEKARQQKQRCYEQNRAKCSRPRVHLAAGRSDHATVDLLMTSFYIDQAHT